MFESLRGVDGLDILVVAGVVTVVLGYVRWWKRRRRRRKRD
jgi:uncharacterized iron-regulated membrane protein